MSAALQEINWRKLYTQYCCGSLFAYCEKVLKYAGGSAARRIHAMSLELTEIRFTVSRELMEKLERVKRLLGYQLKNFSYAALLDKLSDLAIKKYNPRVKFPQSHTGAKNQTLYSGCLKTLRLGRDQGQCTNCGNRAQFECDH